MQAGDRGDVDLFAWFVQYAATAVSHGQLPALFTTAMNAPVGISLMWNTSFLLPGVLLSPVTLLWGPQVSLTVALTLGFAGSAAALFWVLRRWGAVSARPRSAGRSTGFPGTRDRGPRPLPSAVRGPAAADRRCRRPPGHRSRARRQDRPLARAALRRAAVHRGRAPRLHGGREPDPGGGARAEPPQGSAAARPRGAARAGRRGGSVPAPRRVRAVDAVQGPAGRAQQAAGLADRQSQLVRRAVGFAAVSHARQRGRSRCDPAAARRVHGLPGLAADPCPGDRRGGVLAGYPGQDRGGALGGARAVRARRRQPADR